MEFLLEAKAAIVLYRNPLDASQREVHVVDPGTVFFSWLYENYPKGFGRPVRLLYNTEPLPVEVSDVELKGGDVVSVLIGPSGFLATLPVWAVAAIVSAVATIASTLITMLIFGKPKDPSNKAQDADPVYNLSGGANSARLGEPIPVVYGKVVTVPDYVCQPYAYFANNEQYIEQVLCIGQGEHDIHDVLISDTPVSQLAASGAFSWASFTSAQHLQQQGRIEDLVAVHETMVTSIEVSDIELSGQVGLVRGRETFYYELPGVWAAPNQFHSSTALPSEVKVGNVCYADIDNPNSNKTYTIQSISGNTLNFYESVVNYSGVNSYCLASYNTGGGIGIEAGPFVTNRPGTQANLVECDVVFPGGLYQVDEDTGDLLNYTISMTMQITGIDDNGTETGYFLSHGFSITRGTKTPQRWTERVNVPNGRYKVKLIRINGPDYDNKFQSVLVWTGLKARLARTSSPVYGDTHLIATRMRATSGISSDAANRIRVSCTRRLKYNGFGAMVPTRSPSQAFIDALNNPVYGAGLSLNGIDIPRLTVLQSHWAGWGIFDGIINVRSTVWEALQLISAPAVCAPAQVGPFVTMIQDGERHVSTQLFSTANMVADTFTASYSFDKIASYKGYSVEYRDALTFNPAYAIYPPGALDTEKVSLFGCTDYNIAYYYAKLLWQKQVYQRKNVEFETEMEGLLPVLGDRISVSNRIFKWGESGEIALQTGPQQLLLDRDVDWTQYPAPAIILRNELGQPTNQIGITPDVRTVTLHSTIPIGIIDSLARRQPTIFVVGNLDHLTRLYTVTDLEHVGGTNVRISGVVYDERVWEGTLPFLSNPI